MNVTEAVAARISVRAFKPDPVPGALVREILELAHRAPSGGNLQPWRVHALAGEPLAALKTKGMATLAAGLELVREGELEARQLEHFADLFLRARPARLEAAE